MANKIEISISADGNLAVKELGRVEDAIKDTGNAAKKASKQVDGMANSMKALAATDIGSKIAGFASSIAQAGASCIMAAAQMRQYEIAFQTMLKSAEQGTQMLKDLQQFAANTPFDVPGVVQAGQQLMAFGFKAKEIIPMLTSLGDAAAGLGMKSDGVQRLAYALGQMQTSGKLNTQDMMQLTNAGIAAWDMLAQAAGKSVMEIKELTSKGMIDSKEAVKTIVEGMNSQFGGMMDKTSQEVTGLMANIEETAGTTASVVGKYMIDAFNIKGVLKNVSDGLGEFQQKIQEASEKGDNFSKVLRDCIPPDLIIVLGALAGIIGVVLVGALGAAIAALVTFAGLSAPVIAGAAAIGAALAMLVSSWDEITNAISNAIAKAKEFFGIKQAMADDPYWQSSFANTDDDNEAEASNVGIPQAAKKNPNLITNGGNTKGKGSHHKTEEEREIDALLKKYNKVGNTFRDMKYQAEELKVAASMLFGDERKTADHIAALEDINQAHEKTSSELKAELELAQKIINESDRSYVINEIQKQIDAEENLYKAKVKAENYKYDTRNDKSSSDIAKTYLDRAFGTEDEMKKKKEDAQKLMEEIANITKNSIAKGEGGELVAQDIQGQSSALMNILKKTPEQLQMEYATKMQDFKSFTDFLLQTIATATAEEAKSKNIGKQWAEAQVGWVNQIGSSIGTAVSEWLNGTKSIGQAMKDMVKNLLSQAAQLLAQWLTVFAMMSIWNGPQAAAQAANKMVLGIGDMKGVKMGGFKFASGGYVSGDGTGTSDDIPAMLSNGEFVIRSSVVKQLGIPFLQGLNSGKYEHRAGGGLVGTSSNYANEIAISSSSSSNSITLNISAVDASGFGEFLNRGGLSAIKQALTDDDRNFNSAAGVW